MEGISYFQYDCLNIMKDLGITSDKIVLLGGGEKSKLWRQIISDIFNTKIVTLNVEGGPSYGTAILAGVGVWIYKNVGEATDMIIKEVTETNPKKENTEKYAKYYEAFRSLYISLKGEFRKIADI